MDVSPDYVTGMYLFDSLIAGDLATFWSALSHLILPAITLAFVYGAPIFKMVRSESRRRAEGGLHGLRPGDRS